MPRQKTANFHAVRGTPFQANILKICFLISAAPKDICKQN